MTKKPSKGLIPNMDLVVDEDTLQLCFFRIMTSVTADMMAIIDRQYVYHAANSSYLKAFNKTKDELIGQKVKKILGEEQFQNICKPNLIKAFNGEDVLFSTWVEFSSDEKRHLDLHYAPVINKSGEVTYCVATAHDNTKRKIAEEEKENTVIKLKKALNGLN